MRILQVPFCFYPEAVGGTEVYVEGLSRCLQAAGEQVTVVAPGSRRETYEWKGLRVQRFPAQGGGDLRELYGEGQPAAAAAFGEILDEEKPRIVHLHAFTSGVSLRLVREAKTRRIPVVFTYHTPTVSCQRGTLLRWGKEVCDGVLRLGACTRCTLHGLGVPRGMADGVGSVPVFAGEALGRMGLSGSFWTALRMRELLSVRFRAFQALMRETDRVVAVCEWVRDLLLRNGVSAEKIVFSRQGIEPAVGIKNANRSSRGKGRIRIVFAGRCDPSKGAHRLIQAVRKNPALALSLDIYGVAQGSAGSRYRDALVRLAMGDGRIVFREPDSGEAFAGRLADYDLVAVPSQGLETGPFVVLEAFAAGVPVLGSRLGGIAELVRHGIDGWLVEYNSTKDWGAALRKVCQEKDLLPRLRAGILPPRTINAVAREMKALYDSLQGRHASA